MTEVKYKLLEDYVPPIYRQQSVSLEFFLDPKKTVLKSKIHYSHNNDKPTNLIMQGENIQLSCILYQKSFENMQKTTNFICRFIGCFDYTT